jgi:hypothetical protein
LKSLIASEKILTSSMTRNLATCFYKLERTYDFSHREEHRIDSVDSECGRRSNVNMNALPVYEDSKRKATNARLVVTRK